MQREVCISVVREGQLKASCMIEVMLWEDDYGRMKKKRAFGARLLKNCAIDQVVGTVGRSSRASKGWRGKERPVIGAKVEVKEWKTNLLWRRKISSILEMLNLRPQKDS